MPGNTVFFDYSNWRLTLTKSILAPVFCLGPDQVSQDMCSIAHFLLLPFPRVLEYSKDIHTAGQEMVQHYKHKQTQKKHIPWWLYVLLAPAFFFLFFCLGAGIRGAVGLPVDSPDWAAAEFFICIGYTIIWMVYLIVGRDRRDFYIYLPYSVLVLFVAIIGTLLMP